MYANLLAFVNPVYGHHGHSNLSGSYFHYLVSHIFVLCDESKDTHHWPLSLPPPTSTLPMQHHAKATCNFGMTLLPLDILYGSWYAGEAADSKAKKT